MRTRKVLQVVLAAALAAAAAAPLAAQRAAADTLKACYVPGSATVYRTDAPDAPAKCTRGNHVPFKWVDGIGAVRVGEPAAGDLGGAFPAPAVVRIQGRAVSSAPPVDGQVLGWNGQVNKWEPRNPPNALTTGVSAVMATGVGLNPSLQLAFIGPTASVSASGSQVFHITSQKVLGTNGSGASSLRLDICYRPSGGSIVEAGGWLHSLSVGSFERRLFTLAAAVTLPAGTHEVGMCGNVVALTNNWNNNGPGRTTVLILPGT